MVRSVHRFDGSADGRVQECMDAVHKKSRQVIRVTTESSRELAPSSASETLYTCTHSSLSSLYRTVLAINLWRTAITGLMRGMANLPKVTRSY